jgi:hypothetical protein
MFAKMFAKKTVASVVAGFQRAVDDLRTIAAQQTADAGRLSDEARDKRVQAALADAEATKADDIADRIEKLIA